MFTLFIVALGIFLFYVWKEDRDSDQSCIIFIFAILFSLMGISIFLIWNTELINRKNKITLYQKDIVVYQEKYEAVKNTMMVELSEYPIEKEMFEKISPTSILLKYPEIKSDSLILNNINELKDIQDKIFRIKMDINQIKNNLLWHKQCGIFYYIRVVPIEDKYIQKELN